MAIRVTSKTIAAKFPLADLSGIVTTQQAGGKAWLNGGFLAVGAPGSITVVGGTFSGNISLTTAGATILGTSGGALHVGCLNGGTFLGDSAAYGGDVHVGALGIRARNTRAIGWSADDTSYGPLNEKLTRNATGPAIDVTVNSALAIKISGSELSGNIQGRIRLGSFNAGMYVTGGGNLILSGGGTDAFLTSAGLRVWANRKIAWASVIDSGGLLQSTTEDLAITRNAAGVLEINSGTAADYRDLICRGITLTGDMAVGSGFDLLVSNTYGFQIPNDYTIVKSANGLYKNRFGQHTFTDENGNETMRLTTVGLDGASGKLQINSGSTLSASGVTLLELNSNNQILTSSDIVVMRGYGNSAAMNLRSSVSSGADGNYDSPRLKWTGTNITTAVATNGYADAYYTPDGVDRGYLTISANGYAGLYIRKTDNRPSTVGINSLLTDAQLNVEPNWSGKKGILIRGAASQTAKWIEGQRSDGTVTWSIGNSPWDSNAALKLTNGSLVMDESIRFLFAAKAGRFDVLNEDGTHYTFAAIKSGTNGTANALTTINSSPNGAAAVDGAQLKIVSGKNGPLILQGPSANAAGVVIRGYSAQAANLLELQDVGTTVQIGMTVGGAIYASNWLKLSGSNQTTQGMAIRNGSLALASDVQIGWSTNTDPTANQSLVSITPSSGQLAFSGNIALPAAGKILRNGAANHFIELTSGGETTFNTNLLTTDAASTAFRLKNGTGATLWYMNADGANYWSGLTVFGGGVRIPEISVPSNTTTFTLHGGYGGTTAGTANRIQANGNSAGGYFPTTGEQIVLACGGGSTVNQDWRPTSGTANLTGLIIENNLNTSGTYSGTYRSLYIKPILTSTTGLTNIAIESTSGNVIHRGGSWTIQPPASVTPATNGDLTVEATSNTTLTFKLKGTDGVVRTGTLALAA